MPATISSSATADNSAAATPAVSISPGPVSERPPYGKARANVFALGDYLIGDTDDNMLSGHPDIRY